MNKDRKIWFMEEWGKIRLTIDNNNNEIIKVLEWIPEGDLSFKKGFSWPLEDSVSVSVSVSYELVVVVASFLPLFGVFPPCFAKLIRRG